jgi:hypothetical protein
LIARYAVLAKYLLQLMGEPASDPTLIRLESIKLADRVASIR